MKKEIIDKVDLIGNQITNTCAGMFLTMIIISGAMTLGMILNAIFR